MSVIYDYVFFTLERGAPARQAFINHLNAQTKAMTATGGEMLGLFTAQLGWEAAETALVIRWTRGRDQDALNSVLTSLSIKSHMIEHLTPTLRPADDAKLVGGGVHVHRWFIIGAKDLEEFQTLSAEGWKDFEPRFDAKVFGLFLCDENDFDRETKARRLLLITRYADHGVWEASRDPSTAGMQTFMRRAQLTRRTRGVSALLTRLGVP